MTGLRPLAAEAVGTAFLLATVIGSGIMGDRLSGGSVGLALLANTIATGAILVVIIRIFGPVSGAHFNPAVTLVLRLRGEINTRTALGFVLAQIIGGYVGTLAAHAMFVEALVQFSSTNRTGLGQWVAEAVATFGLILTIIGTLRAKADFVAIAVGLYITAAYWFTASTSFANPAVTIARGFSDTFAGIRPTDVPAFVLVQLLAATAAHFYCSWQFPDED